MTPLYRSSVTIVSTLLLFVISINSVAQHAIFKVIDSQQQSRSVPHTIVKINGMDYISLPKITKALGGTYTIQPRRMRVDLAGTTAWVSLNDNRVSAISLFSLTHKVVENDEGVFISRVDAPFFFRNAFQLTLVPEQAGSYDAAPSALPMAEEVAQALEEFPVPTEVKNFNGGSIFQQGVILRKVSRFVAGTDEDALLPIPVFYDPETNKILTDSVPKDLREEMKDELC